MTITIITKSRTTEVTPVVASNEDDRWCHYVSADDAVAIVGKAAAARMVANGYVVTEPNGAVLYEVPSLPGLVRVA